MKRLALHLFMVAAVALLGGCESDIFSEEIPAYPQFKASTSSIDFGRIEVRTTLEQAVRFSNMGGEGSVLYLYYYLEGHPAFHLVTPEREVALHPTDAALTVVIAFTPERGGGAEGNLVVYASDRPLREDTHVTAYRIVLKGAAGKGCEFPGPPARPAPQVRKVESSR